MKVQSPRRTGPRLPLYEWLFRHVLQRINPERAHELAISTTRLWGEIPGALPLTERLLQPAASLRVSTLGLDFRSPLGLAAGVDKNSRAFDGLAALGFGSIEVGTATNLRQGGNPRPRMWRVPSERALLNSMGFPNDGAEEHARRLARRRTRTVVGGNIGKSKAIDVADAVGDYRSATGRLAPFADYLALNVSSPNTEGLRSMQTTVQLAELMRGVRAELDEMGRTIPVLVKLGPDLADETVVAIAAAAWEMGIDGLIAVNTTTAYAQTPADLSAIKDSGGQGGLSGRPLVPRALAVLSLLSTHGGDLPIISVGGVEDGEDVWRRILAGATLVQAYSGFVYGGPLWPHRVNRELAHLLAASPYGSIEEAVGKGSEFELDGSEKREATS